MGSRGFLKESLLTLIFVAGFYGAPAFAAKDVIYPSEAGATVNGATVAVSNNFQPGSSGHTTLDNAVYADDTVVVTATWRIQDKSKPNGTNTDYASSRTVNFTVLQTTGTTGTGTVSPTFTTGAQCTGIMSNIATCQTVISFIAPANLGNYQLQITAADPGTPANTRLEGPNDPDDPTKPDYAINFSVDEKTVEPPKKETKLTVDRQCVLLNGNVDLTATLEELVGGAGIGGANIAFAIDATPVGSATTSTSGVATWPTYNVTGLSVGDHNLYAEFAGNEEYLNSNDSDTLGISYLFMGFSQPINGDGTSIFGGRVIPIKIRLLDANGDPVTDAAPTVLLFSYEKDLGVGGELEKVSSVSAADTDNIMRYVPEEKQYIYNWDAKDLANGTYAVVVDLGDSATCRTENPYAIITVAKKGGKN